MVKKLLVSLVRGWLVSWCWVGGLVGGGAVWGLVSSFDFLDNGVETTLVVGGVFDDTGGTVSFQKAVGSLDVTVSVSVFGLALDVVCGRVVDAVLEAVRGRGVDGLWGVSLWCRVSGCWVSGGVSGLVGRGGVLGDGGNHACGEDDQL